MLLFLHSIARMAAQEHSRKHSLLNTSKGLRAMSASWTAVPRREKLMTMVRLCHRTSRLSQSGTLEQMDSHRCNCDIDSLL